MPGVVRLWCAKKKKCGRSAEIPAISVAHSAHSKRREKKKKKKKKMRVTEMDATNTAA